MDIANAKKSYTDLSQELAVLAEACKSVPRDADAGERLGRYNVIEHSLKALSAEAGKPPSTKEVLVAISVFAGSWGLLGAAMVLPGLIGVGAAFAGCLGFVGEYCAIAHKGYNMHRLAAKAHKLVRQVQSEKAAIAGAAGNDGAERSIKPAQKNDGAKTAFTAASRHKETPGTGDQKKNPSNANGPRNTL